jgi:hypothetical protein
MLYPFVSVESVCVSFHLLVRVFRASEPALQPQPELALNKGKYGFND